MVSPCLSSPVCRWYSRCNRSALESARQGDLNPVTLVFILIVAVAVVYFVVFVERGQRRLTVNYAQRQGPSGIQCPDFPPAAESEHGGCYPGHFRQQPVAVPDSSVSGLDLQPTRLAGCRMLHC